MRDRFADILFTDAVKAEQSSRGSRDHYEKAYERFSGMVLDGDEKAFIETRDHFFMATVNADGWPYVQHRGGPPGFLKALDQDTLGFADYRGNRQYISTGNLAGDDRVSLFLMDAPRKARLKILGHAKVTEAADNPELADRLAVPDQGRVERLFTIRLAGFDWNCPQFITPRYTEAQIQAMLAPRFSALAEENEALKARIAELEHKGPQT